MNYEENIGKRVRKGAIGDGKPTNKKFKSGLLVNTVKSIVSHPILGIPAYTFEEDDTCVECRRCYPVDLTETQIDIIRNITEHNETVEVFHDNGLGKK